MGKTKNRCLIQFKGHTFQKKKRILMLCIILLFYITINHFMQLNTGGKGNKYCYVIVMIFMFISILRNIKKRLHNYYLVI